MMLFSQKICLSLQPNNFLKLRIMKKLMFILVMVVACLSSKAQSITQPGEKYPVYCNMKGYNTWGVGKVKVMLDIGFKTTNFESILDENGKQIKFNTMMEAINYMAKRGWVLDQVYFLTEGMSKQNVANYIMKKMVTDDNQIREGLNTMPDKD